MTTSPLTPRSAGSEIEQVFGDQQPAPAPATVRQEWSRFGAFLKHPQLPFGGATHSGAARATLRMLWLDLPVMAVLIGSLSLAAALGLEIPENINTTLEPNLATIALVVIAAPLLEELAFRSWLSGHPSVIGGAVVALIGFAAVPFVVSDYDPDGAVPAMMIIGPAIALIGIPIVAIMLLKKPVPRFFSAGFPVFFWLSTVGFAAIHLVNYTNGAPLLLMPLLLLPQFILGAMLGYLRVHHGLIAAIALHAVHNAILFGLAILGGLGAEAPAPVAG